MSVSVSVSECVCVRLVCVGGLGCLCVQRNCGGVEGAGCFRGQLNSLVGLI